MPDKEGKLTQPEKVKVVKWLTDHVADGHDFKCAVCGHTDWVVGDHIVTPVRFASTGFHFGGGAYPQIMLICKNCAHTVFLNAAVMGITAVARDEKPVAGTDERQPKGLLDV